jgi:hypothetical protein
MQLNYGLQLFLQLQYAQPNDATNSQCLMFLDDCNVTNTSTYYVGSNLA